jgi:hypothetical protein
MNREDGIRIIAYHIWEKEGCGHGSDVEQWLKAEVIWQEQNKPARTGAEIQPWVGIQQNYATGKTKPASVFIAQQSKKGKSSKRKP